MKFKRFMALAMAGAMTLGMSGTALADLPGGKPSNGVTVTKTLTIAEGISATGDVTFTLKSDDSWDDEYKNPAGFTFDDMDNITISGLSSSTTKGTKVISTDIEKAITEPGVYHFVLTENLEAVDAGKFGWTVVDSTKYFIRVYAKKDGDKLTFKYGIWKSGQTGTPDVKVGGDEEEEGQGSGVNFENTFTAPASFTLTKAVSQEEYANADELYKFTATIKLPATANGVAAGKITGAQSGSATDITANGDYTVVLKNNETANFNNLPAGTKVVISEDISGLVNFDKATYNGSANGQTISSSKEHSEISTLFILGDGRNAVTCTNAYKEVTITGLAVNVAPFIAMFAAVAGAIAMYVAAKRRVR